MATYNVTGPDGHKYRVTGPDGASDEEVLAQIKSYKPPSKPTSGATGSWGGSENTDSTAGFIGGNLNKGIAGLAGLPVDTARNVLNLGIAGYGSVKGALGGTPPELIPPGIGSSQHIEGLMQRGGMIPPSTTPQSKAGEYGAAALQMIPGALASPGTAAQLPAKALAGAVSGVGAQAASDVLGEPYAALGAMAPGAKGMLRPPSIETRAAAGRKAEMFGKAKELDIPVAPREMKVDPVQVKLESVINSELMQPPGTAVTPATLKNYQKYYWQDYENVTKSKALENGVRPNERYINELKTIGDEIERSRTVLPRTFEKMRPITQMLMEYGYGQKTPTTLPPDVAMRAIKKMRNDASTNFSSDKPEMVELARVQRKMAITLENLIEDNLVTDPGVMQRFKTARTNIAKANDVESSLDPVTRKVSGARLSSLLTEGSPMTGGMKNLAEVSGEFPQATQQTKQVEDFSKRMSPHAVTSPTTMGAHWLTKMWDPLTKSSPYQNLMVDPSRKLTPEQLIRLRYQAAAQAANRPPGPEVPQ